MKKTTCILFNGGSYGTFIEWSLNYFSNLDFCNELPFTATGSSHNFVGHHLVDFASCKEYVTSNITFPMVRLHPKTLSTENIIENLDFINQNFEKVIYIMPTFNTIAWNINNKFEKIWDEGWIAHNQHTIAKDLAEYNPMIPLEHMTKWELREFLSLYIFNQHVTETELHLSTVPGIVSRYSNFHFVTIDALRDNFASSLKLMLSYCNLELSRSNQIEAVHASWLATQFNSHKDIVISKIVDSVLSNNVYDWAEITLTLVDEALIQHYLRTHGMNIRCYDLDTFPTNSIDLRNYIE